MVTGFIQQQPPFPFAGEAASLCAAFLWACCINIYRHWGRDISSHTLNFFKNLVGVVCLVLSVLLVRPDHPQEAGVYGMLALSGIVGLAMGDTAFFASLKRLGSQISSAGLCLSPVFAVLIAYVFLHEELSVYELVGIVMVVTALLGSIYFGRQGKKSPLALISTKTFIAGIVFAVIAALGNGSGIVMSREAFQKAHILSGTLIRMAPAVLLLILFQKKADAAYYIKEKKRVFAVIGIASFFGTFLGVLLFSTGTKYAKAGVASALTSTFPVWVIPISWLFFHEKTNWQSVLSIVLAVCGIMVIFLGETLLAALSSLSLF